MPVKFFCNKCGKEMWQGIDHASKNTLTIAQAESVLECSDCFIEEMRKHERIDKIKKDGVDIND